MTNDKQLADAITFYSLALKTGDTFSIQYWKSEIKRINKGN